VDTQPQIRLYKYDPSEKMRDMEGHFERSHVAEWQGALVAYEIFNWFKLAQAQGHLSADVEWPPNDNVSIQ
jgi:hypothetical protein